MRSPFLLSSGIFLVSLNFGSIFWNHLDIYLERDKRVEQTGCGFGIFLTKYKEGKRNSRKRKRKRRRRALFFCMHRCMVVNYNLFPSLLQSVVT